MRAFAYDPTEGVFFAAVDLDGRLIELRQPHAHDVPCAACSVALARPGGADQHRARDDRCRPEPDLRSLYPAPGARGHDCSATFPGPVWTATTSRDPVIVVSLAEAVASLPGDRHQPALEAHLRAAVRVHQHLCAVVAILSGATGAAATFDVCLACLTQPADHAASLRADLAEKAAALAGVLRGGDDTGQPQVTARSLARGGDW